MRLLGLCCLLSIAIFAAIALLSIVALIFVGGQVSTILSTTGRSLETTEPTMALPTAAAPAGSGATSMPTLTPVTTLAPVVAESEKPLPSLLSELPHQAPEVEALAPATVDGRDLSIWSVKGDTWLEVAGMTPGEISTVRKTVAEAGVSLDDVAQVIAGRSSVEEDPPYFVYIYRIPPGASDAVLPLAIGTAGFKNGLDPSQFQTSTLGGKQVYVGTEDMLDQSEHQRGRPYWYEIDDQTLAIVVTDKEDWAIDALRQLP